MTEEHSCLLRRLNICRTTFVLTLAPGVTEPCYCETLALASSQGDERRASQINTQRARAVANAGEIERRAQQRQRLLEVRF